MKIAKYFLVGAVGASVDLAIYATLIYGMNETYLLAGGASFVLSTFVNYFLSIRYVFRTNARFSSSTEIMMIYFVSGIGLVFHQLILFASVGYLGFHVIIAKCVTMGVVFVWNYSIRTHFVFAERLPK